jgi:hypothetical protein
MVLHPAIKNILAFCIGIAASFLLLAGFVLFFSKSGIILNQNDTGSAFSYQKDEFLGYTLLPNQEITRRDAAGEFTVVVNNIGFRDRKYELVNDQSFTNIIILGDSFTFGGMVRLPYPNIFESLLKNALNYKLQVFNFGTPGYGTVNEHGVLQQYGDNIIPSIVIVAFFLGNDFHDNLIPLDQIKVINGYLVYNVITWSNQKALLSDNDLIQYVNLATTKNLSPYSLAQLIRVDKFGNQMTFIERTARQLGINFPAVRTIIDLIKPNLSMNSIHLFGITNPAYYKVTEEEERITKEVLIKIKNNCQRLDAELVLVMIPENIGTYDNGHRRSALKKICSEAGITHTIDLFPLFKDSMDKYYLEYDAHFSQLGHHALADVLARYILAHNLLRPERTGP